MGSGGRAGIAIRLAPSVLVFLPRALAGDQAGTGEPRQVGDPRARRLALLGLTDTEIADLFGISPDTLYEWRRRHPEFSDSIDAGKIEADAEVAESLYRRARGAKVPAVKIFMPAGANAPVYAPYVEEYPPDTGAAFRWLMNRQPEKWRDRREVDVTGSIAHRSRK